jgi:hypothetical protein
MRALIVVAEAQVLQLSVSSMRERFNFLHSLGLTREEITAICSRTHVLSLSVEANLAPKVVYLTQQMQHHVSSLAKYPSFLTLSLQHRCAPALPLDMTKSHYRAGSEACLL